MLSKRRASAFLACCISGVAAAQSPVDVPSTTDTPSPPEAAPPSETPPPAGPTGSAPAPGAGSGQAAAVPDQATDEESAARVGKERERHRVALAVTAGTLGVGVEGIYGIFRQFNVRGQVNYLALDHGFEKDNNDYQGRARFFSIGLLGDVYPFARVPVVGNFRLTGGIYSNNDHLDLNAGCLNGCNAGGLSITSVGPNPAQLYGNMHFNRWSPYTGFGFGNAMQGGHLHFAFDLGALFQGRPKVSLGALGSGTYAAKNCSGSYACSGSFSLPGATQTDQTVASAVASEQQTLIGDVKNYTVYPIVSFTIGYRFGF
jgi:hypothetical protein